MTRGHLRLLAFRAAAAIVPRLPEWLAYPLALAAAEMAFRVLGGVRRSVEANLAPVLGPHAPAARRRAVARGVFRTAALNYLELFRLPALDAATLGQRVHVRHAERLHAAWRRGRGVIAVTAHLGPFDAVVQIASLIGLRVTIPVEQIEPPALRDLVTGLRASQGVRFVPLGTAALRESVRTLRSGGAVTLPLDRDVQGDGLPLPFFGRAMTVPDGPVVLAARTGATILPVFAVRDGWRRGTILVEEPVSLVCDERGEVDVPATLRVLLAVLERTIAAHADQWLVFVSPWREPCQPRRSPERRSGAPVR